MDHTNPTDTRNPADTTADFQARLAELLLSAYGRGAVVETSLEIEGPASDAPNWRVTIEKCPPAECSYEPTMLDGPDP